MPRVAPVCVLACRAQTAPRLLLGVDTEWGEVADAAGASAPPAVLQLAALHPTDAASREAA